MASLTGAALAATALAAAGITIHVTTSPFEGTENQPETFSGKITGAPRGAEALLVAQGIRTTNPAAWTTIGHAAIGRGHFTIKWRPTHPGLVPYRVTVRDHARNLARTKTLTLTVAQPPENCAPAAPPTNVPTGDGWIQGGLYIEGGPFPGVFDCQTSTSYTLSVTGATGATLATQPVAGGASYTVVLPAGSYKLAATDAVTPTGTAGLLCTGTATVTAGKGTTADVVCPVP
jgi:hypothetical protein